MIGLFIAFVLLFQTPDSLSGVSTVSVLHDSLLAEDQQTLNLTELSGWEFTTDDPFDSTESAKWIKLEVPVSQENPALDSLWNGYGYYRLKFKVDSTFSLNKAFLGYSSATNVSAEIYLNNELVLKIGNPSKDKDSEEIIARYNGIGQPVNLDPNTEYELAVKKSYHRYSLYDRLTLGGFNQPYMFSINLASPEYVQTRIDNQKTFLLVLSISLLVIFMLAVLYLILYFKVKTQKENLWLVLLMAVNGCIALNVLLAQLTFSPFWVNLNIALLGNISLPLAFTLVPLVTHKLLKVHAHIVWKAYAIVGLFIFIARLGTPAILIPVITVISILGGLFAIYKAYKQGVQDTIIPAISLLGIPIVMLVFFILLYFGINIGSGWSYMIFSLIMYLSLPVGLSIYQGKKFLRLHSEMDDLVVERTTQLETANKKLEKSLVELTATQSQLIQQEKLASLGQLTAGIAHEIKNPLNFVNNFSELSVELIEEAREELSAFSRQLSAKESDDVDQDNSPLEEGGNSSTDESPGDVRKVKETLEILEILNDIEANLRKIHEHGSRADSIVKAMLEHSRGGSGQKEPTDLNALVKEFANLSFHGMRASNNPINVDMEFNLDESIGEVPLIAEDFSRVIVNLCNNAFDAMRDVGTQNLASLPQGTKSDYKPKLTVRTRSENKKVVIEIEDNGSGIPEEMKDKILQPFFTTKKGTEGTGLGLSITNDIVKAHGGQIDVYSQPGQTVFTIKLMA